MRKIVVAITIIATVFLNAQTEQEFFDAKDLMNVGVYYYPEHWPEEQWNRDLKNMANKGFEFTHYGEFAWAFMEPEEGVYDFTWLDKAVALAHKNGLKVIMCTPTPTPPAWMSTKYPDILMENAEGRIVQHGSRQHISWSSETYRGFVEKIVTKLAERYGNDPRIWGWQLDNEPSHYGLQYDYGKAAQKRFKEWLKRKYQTLDELNTQWGNAFWSEVYTDWEQIRIPNEKEQVLFINPHAILDFKRFNAEEAADFLRFQAKVLRTKIAPEQWITTNFMVDHSAVDPSRNSDLDVISWTSYPVAGSQGIGDEGFRRGAPNSIGHANDMFRPINGLSGCMELQISQVCWGDYNPRMYPGSRKMLLYHVLAGGNKFVCSYRYRQPTFNFEQDILGIVGTDGVTLTDGGEEFVEFIKELKKLRKVNTAKSRIPKQILKGKTAILDKRDNQWLSNYRKQTSQWNHVAHQGKYYDILKQLGISVAYIREDADFSEYPFLIAPAYEMVDTVLVDKWKNYVQQGGNLVLTVRSGIKTNSGLYPETKRAAIISDLIGAEVEFYDNLPKNKPGHVKFASEPYSWSTWADVLKPNKSTETLAVFDDQFYKGKTAITRVKHGKGTVTYIGVDASDGELEKRVLEKLYTDAGVGVKDYPKGLVVEWRHGLWFAINYGPEEVTVAIPSDAELLVGERKIPSAGVAVWKDDK